MTVSIYGKCQDCVDIGTISALAPSPSFVVDKAALRNNLEILDDVQKRSGAKILLAMKAFSFWDLFPLISETLNGVCASSPWEARLGREEFGKEVHSFAAAFKESAVNEILAISDHLVFNSFSQMERFRPFWEKSGVSVGLRVNPEHSEGHTPMYDPCAPESRLGISLSEFEGKSLEGVDGLHFHTLCEELFDPLSRTAKAFEEKFAKYMHQMKWLNIGGGHHITREGYDIEGLIRLVTHLRETYSLESLYIEPGEAVVLGTGLLISEVLDIVHNAIDIAILDVSATCHLPDVLEMPYRPVVTGGFDPGEKPCTYRLAGASCLAGDIIGDWSFEKPLKVGDRIIFEDMSHYTMVKTTMFNGIHHPSLCTYDPETKELSVIRSFCYDDFKSRLS